jgi:hypothetical protein
MNRNDFEEILITHCREMGIFEKNAANKKIETILDAVTASMIRSDMSKEDVIECIGDIKNDSVLDISVFEKGGNIKDYIKPKWYKFARSLWRQRPVGVGTPNAACGEGELMFLFISPHTNKPTKGDIMIKGVLNELKAEGARIDKKLGGKTFNDRTVEVAKKYKLKPNMSKGKNLLKEAVEIEKGKHTEHWKNEIGSLPLELQKSFVREWLSCIDGEMYSVEEVFVDGVFNQDKLIKKIVKVLFKNMIEEGGFDNLILLGDGSNIKIISADVEVFNKMIDDDVVKTSANYFRVHQSTNIGWYVY